MAVIKKALLYSSHLGKISFYKMCDIRPVCIHKQIRVVEPLCIAHKCNNQGHNETSEPRTKNDGYYYLGDDDRECVLYIRYAKDNQIIHLLCWPS